MSRLIDADKMCEDLATVDMQYETTIDWAIRVTKAQPTVDAAQVKHGHWIQEGEPPMFSLTCSVCGQKFFNHYLQPHANYCSMCGTKMDDSTQSNDSNVLDALERR